MKLGQTACFLMVLIGCICFIPCTGQTLPVSACAAFSTDGTSATGTIKGGDLETRLTPLGSPPKIFHSPVGSSIRCEVAFSNDSRWLVTVVSADKLTVLITDRAAGTLHGRFESEWNMPLERDFRFSFLGGFSDDQSLILWRYKPQEGATGSDASSVRIHLQHWSVDGVLRSDQDLGLLGDEGGSREPLSADGFEKVWVPGGCGIQCYRGVSFKSGYFVTSASMTMPKANAATPINLPKTKSFFSVSGERIDQQATLLDYSGKIKHQVSLPYGPNLLGPLAPDWFYTRHLTASSDEQFAAVGRTRVSWVLVDTARDWGSEVVLLQLQPLRVLATLKTGKGGIAALAVDHRNDSVRVLGFWKHHWHDLDWRTASPKRWKDNFDLDR